MVCGCLPALGPYLLVGFLRLRALARGRMVGSKLCSTAWPIAPVRVIWSGGVIPAAVMIWSRAV